MAARARSFWTDVGGGVAVVAMLALASPGVRVARADPAPAPAPGPTALFAGTSEPAGMCAVDAEPTLARREVSRQIAERLRQAMAGEDGDAVVLNGRGYNYARRSDPAAALALIEAEARRQEAASR